MIRITLAFFICMSAIVFSCHDTTESSSEKIVRDANASIDSSMRSYYLKQEASFIDSVLIPLLNQPTQETILQERLDSLQKLLDKCRKTTVINHADNVNIGSKN